MESNFTISLTYVHSTHSIAVEINESSLEENISLHMDNSIASNSKVQQFPLLHSRWSNEPEAPYVVQLIIGLFAMVLGSGGLVGNILVIYLFIRYRQLRRSANLFVLNLAIGDFFLIITNIPLLVASSFHSKWLGGIIGCRLFAFCGGLSGFVSINTLAVLSVERCVVITCHLPNTNRLSKRGVICLCFVIWIYSFLWSIPPYIGWGGHMMEGSRTSCTFDYFTKTTNNRSYVLSILVFCFFAQLLVISGSYFKIAQAVFAHQKDVVHSNQQADDAAFCLRVSSKNRHQIEWRTAKTVLSLVMIFCVSWTPYAIISVIGQFGNQTTVTPLSSAIPGIFAKMSSFLNPIFYTLIHSKYRKLIISQCKKVGKRSGTATKPDTKCSSNSDSECKQYKVVLAVKFANSRSTLV